MEPQLTYQMIFIRRLLTLAFAASLVSSAVAQEGKLNIATVDMQELFKHYYHTNEAQKQINVERARINKETNERRDQDPRAGRQPREKAKAA